MVAELYPHDAAAPAVSLESSFDADLGFDSLARAELLARVEQAFHAGLPEELFADMEAPADLLQALLSSSVPIGAEHGPSPIRSTLLEETQQTPASAKTLVDVLRWHARLHPQRAHVTLYSDKGDDQTISYGELQQRAQATAAGLQDRNVQPGDAVAIMLATGLDYFTSFYGILTAGAIPVPIYPPSRRSQIEEHLRRQIGILDNCEAVMLITEPEAKRVSQFLRLGVRSLHTISTPDEIERGELAFERPAIDGQSIALLQYTSGSTGDPKGVILSHANLIANIRADGEAVEVDSSDVFVSWLPLYHDMGLIGAWLGSLYHGIPLVVMSPIAFLTSPERWLRAIQRYGGTLSASPNFGYELCLRRLANQKLEGLDLSRWRAALNGAEAVSPGTIRRFRDRFEPYGFRPEAMMPVYGLAENTVGLCFPPLGREPVIDTIRREPFTRAGEAKKAGPGDAATLQFVACGQPLSRHRIRIVDNDGRELPDRVQGRIEFRGPSATRGYLRNPEATRRLFHGEWLDTGDLGYTADGDLYISGRAKDIILRAGRNIYPDELEQAIGNLPGIRKGCVAVFGKHDPASGTEKLVVLAETREPAGEAHQRLRTLINAEVTSLIGATPDEIAIVPPRTVLKTSSGKIRRAASRDRYERGEFGKKTPAVWRQLLHLAGGGVTSGFRRLWRSLGELLFAGWAWAVFGVLSIFAWILVLLLPRLAQRRRILHTGARMLARATGTPLMVELPERGALPEDWPHGVLVANHASYLDGFALVAALPFNFSFVAKKELEAQFFAGFFLRRIGAVFVERFDRQSTLDDARELKKSLAGNDALLFFPEGTFTRVPGLRPFHLGAFITAAEAGVPVTPIALRGTRPMLRSKSWFPVHGEVALTVGTPVDPRKLATPSANKTWEQAL
ncbi:MAG: AMP-binding protein, partial [Pseudomonadota bacterium]|nr:AMP-binding protein [Pseudomonadota bacterium]